VNTSTQNPTCQILTSFFHLPPETIRICDKYYILYWESRYLYTQLLQYAGRVVREKISYTPVFLDGLGSEELGANPEMQVRLSFRRLSGKIGGYVLISRTHKLE
jgi:hypothetical protein